MSRRDSRQAGFSLVELLVVIGIIGLLLGLFLPAVQRVRESAARLKCANNLRQIGLALHNFHDANGRLPPLPAKTGSRDPNAILSWRVLLLPYLEQDAIWAEALEACRIDANPNHNPPHVALPAVLAVYVCPDDDRLSEALLDRLGNLVAFSSYVGVAGDVSYDGTLGMQPGIRLADITDGTSQTLMVGERPPPDTLESGNWYRQGWIDDAMTASGLPIPDEPCEGPFHFGPGQIQNRCDQFHFWSLHPAGANFLCADGSVHFLTYDAADILPALATRAGGEAVGLPD